MPQIYLSFIIYFFYLVFSSFKGNKTSIAILTLTNLYNYFFAKDSETLKKVYSEFKYFKKFEVVSEEPIDTSKSMLPVKKLNIFFLF